tara:strand:- start:18 stop:629 length:612 start_codon:yes stop_codon:yes gene_type:complete
MNGKATFQADLKERINYLNVYLQTMERDCGNRNDYIDALTSFICDPTANVIIISCNGKKAKHTKEEALIERERHIANTTYASWQLKTTRNLICFYSHTHNLNIAKATEYLHKIKDRQHEGLEKLDEMYKKSPNNFIGTYLKNDGGKAEEIVKNDMGYKEVCNEIMDDFKTAERYFIDLQIFTQAKEVNKSTKKMVKRKRKNNK